jgi:hypothetical protein
MYNFFESLSSRIGVRFDWYDVLNKPLFVMVAPRDSVFFKQAEFLLNQQGKPGRIFDNFASAISALPQVGSANNPVPATLYFAEGKISTNTSLVIPKSLAGLTVYQEFGSELVASADLGSGNHVLTSAADKVTMYLNGRFYSDSATQAGGAVAIGGTTDAIGNGNDNKVFNLTAGSFGAGDDFTQTVLVRGSDRVDLVNVNIQTNAAPGMQVSANSSSNNCNRVRFINCIVRTKSNARPLLIDATQADGSIIGGLYENVGTNSAIQINGSNWFIGGGGLAANQSTVGANQPVDLATATDITIGQWFVKDIDAATAPTQLDQTNV